MLNVLELFSGIGAQAKALGRLRGLEFKIVGTADWDIHAIIAYDLIHNGKQNLEKYERYSKEQMVSMLSKYTLSWDGKVPTNTNALRQHHIDVLRSLLCAIERTKNYVSITDIKAAHLPKNIHLLTYSFPCQDLSIAGVWHGNMSGIDRHAHNRSGMLWEVERILKECYANGNSLPKFLLMENVSNILSARHRENFEEWKRYLHRIGYYNHIYCLNANNFGIPQIRKRAFMISVFTNHHNDRDDFLRQYFATHNLEDKQYITTLPLQKYNLADLLRTNYNIKKYFREANIAQIPDTLSRRKIIEENDKILYRGCCLPFLKTITTKQDRNPNSGVIEYAFANPGKLPYRYLTPRECFLLMGFDEKDYDAINANSLYSSKGVPFFTSSKLIKLAGNSIVVNVLESIFRQILDIQKQLKVNSTQHKTFRFNKYKQLNNCHTRRGKPSHICSGI